MPLRPITLRKLCRSRAGLLALFLTSAPLPVRGATVTWVGGSADWAEGDGNNSRWNPADEPDADDHAVCNTPANIRLVSSNTVSGLTLAGAVQVSLNGYQLTVNGTAGLSGAGTALRLDGTGSAFQAQGLTLSDSVTLSLGRQSKITVSNAWTLPGGGAIQVKNGSTTGPGALPGSIATIAGGRLTQTGGSITVEDDDGTLEFAAPFTMTGGNLSVNGQAGFSADSALGGVVNIGGGAPTTFTVAVDRTLQFSGGCSATLTGNLRLQGDVRIEQGAVFSGPGTLSNAGYTNLTLATGAELGVPLDMAGVLHPGGSGATGTVHLKDLKLSGISILSLEMKGTGAQESDRLIASGPVQLAGTMDLSILGDFDPAPGTVFEVITAPAGITGRFAGTSTHRLAFGKVMELTYGATFVRAVVYQGTHYDQWVLRYPSLAPADRLRSADPDRDGLVNLAEYALNSDPLKSSSGRDRFYPRILPVEGENVFTLTVPVRFTANRFPTIQPPGELAFLEPDDNMRYRIQAGDTTAGFTHTVEEVDPAWSFYFHYTLPPLEPEWRYVTFRAPGSTADDKSEFMRVLITP